VHHAIDVNDRRLARIVKRCRDLPGYELFSYLDADGEQHSVDSSDVNDYLREITSQHFTAKDFRTWAGTVLASMTLREFEPFESESQAKKNVLRAIEAVAARLGNTPSVCRKCYVHPAVLESYMGGAMAEAIKQDLEREIAEQTEVLQREESALLRLLQQRLLLAAAGSS
jgi:DNA topoisomerase-1